MADLATALADEIERVSRKHERWQRYMRDMPEMAAGMRLGATLMQAEIDRAKVALAGGQASEMIAPLEALRGYNDDD